MENIVAMEISKEEANLILKHRKETARKERIEELGNILITTLAEIEKLGGNVRLPGIGGKYVSYHHPSVRADNVSIGFSKWG